MRGLNETTSYCFRKTPNNLLTYVALILRPTYPLYMNATHAPKLLEENNNRKCVILKPAN